MATHDQMRSSRMIGHFKKMRTPESAVLMTSKAQNCALHLQEPGRQTRKGANFIFDSDPEPGIKTVFGFLIPKSCLR